MAEKYNPDFYYVYCDLHPNHDFTLEQVTFMLSRPPRGEVFEGPCYQFGLWTIRFEAKIASHAEMICDWLQNRIAVHDFSLEALQIMRVIKSL